MELLFVNACMRAESRTERLARMWLEQHEGPIEEVNLGSMSVAPLDCASIVTYGRAVSSACYDDSMFDVAKQFANAKEILIAAPLWNFSLPSKLCNYLELVCTQGITFDVAADGSYVSLCRASRLTFVTTAGGIIRDRTDDHAFGLLQTLSRQFWHIPQVERIAAEGLDATGVDVDAALRAALRQ